MDIEMVLSAALSLIRSILKIFNVYIQEITFHVIVCYKQTILLYISQFKVTKK